MPRGGPQEADRSFYAQPTKGKHLKNTMPHLDYRQFQLVRSLVRQCCNNDKGNYLLLDNGWELCVCVQSISRLLVCKYFQTAVLPLDRELGITLLYKNKRCCWYGALFRPGSNRGKYCSNCAAAVHCQQKAGSGRRRRTRRGQLGA